MSLLEALQMKRRCLKTTDTVLTTSSGEVFLEKRTAAGETKLERVSSREGYVVDLKPDLQVASVLPGLFMGSQDVTQDESLLRKYGITHILSVGIQVPKFPSFEYIFIEALDLPEFNMKSVFDQCSECISCIKKSGGSVYIHCNAGVSRSASVVIAYLMKSQNIRFQQAYDLLKQGRSCIKPNDGFVKQLKLLDEELFSE